jgi:branched-chain amino acid transport system substrate-binding protein
MSKNAKIVWWIVGIVVVVGLVWWGIAKNGGSGNTIKIGFFGPLTGDASTYGEPFQKVVELAVGQINAAGGINGKQVEVIYEDDQCTGALGASAVQKLVNVDHVQAILGGGCSGATIAAIPIAAAAKVVMLSPLASSPKLTGASPYFFRDYPSDASQASIYADVGYHQKGWRTVAIMEEQTDYATALGDSFSKAFEGYGGKVIVQEFPTTVTDLRSPVLALKAQKPDALFIDTQSPATAQETLDRMSQLGWKIPLIVDDTLEGDSATLQKYATQLEGAITAEFIQNASDTAFQAFVSAYQAKYGEVLPYQNYGQTEYDAVYLLADGIKAVGYNGQALAAWSRTVKDWKGVSGLVTIGPDGDRVGGDALQVIHKGQAVPVKQ